MERFWSNVNIGNEDECWEWEGSRDAGGYGNFYYEGRTRKAHRIPLRLDGVDVSGEYVCHTCDNPSCVNPNHLWVGSPHDNTRDMIDKGRARFDGQDQEEMLTPEEANEIRERYREEDITQSALGDEYGVSQPQISFIVNNKTSYL